MSRWDPEMDSRRVALANDGLTSTRNLELAELAVQTGAAEIERARATHVAAQAEVQSMRAEKTRTEATLSAELDRARASLQQARAELATTDALLQEREVVRAVGDLEHESIARLHL